MSGGEIALIVLVALLLFGAKGMPEIARVLGKTLREVRKATDDIKREINQETGVLNEIREIRSEVQNVGQNVGKQILAGSNESGFTVEEPFPNPVRQQDPPHEDPYGLNEPSSQTGTGESIKASEIISSRKK